MGQTFEWISTSVKETQQMAERLARYLKPGDVLALDGDLGAGKTNFTQGLARGLGVTAVVNSPTFTIIKEYSGRYPLYHMDVYRLEDEWEDLGFDEYFYGDGITVVEWPSRIAGSLPDERLWIEFRRADEAQIDDTGDGKRILRFQPLGERYRILCEELIGR